MIIPPALKSRPFQLYWIGHLVSITGSQMQLWALYWHLRTLSDQPMVISGIGLARFLPVILLSLIAGVVADRFNRRKIAIFTQLALGLVAMTLGIATASKLVTLLMIFSLMALQAVVVAFDGPARQALIPSLVPRQDLANAYSLTSIASKVGGIVGPAIGGMVIAFWGLQWAYWLNAVSYLAVIVALLGMRYVPELNADRKMDLGADPNLGVGRAAFRQIREGIEFIRNSPIILSVMILDFFGTFFSSANTLLPFVARDILHVGALQYGWLSSAQAIGTLSIGVYLSQRSKLLRQGMLIIISVALFGAATIVFGLSTSYWLTLFALILIGVFDGLSSIIRNTARQILTPDEMRGRMMSITQIFFKGGPQLGEVESGLVAQILGVPFAIVSGGVGCVLATWIVVRKIPQLWRYSGEETSQAPLVAQ